MTSPADEQSSPDGLAAIEPLIERLQKLGHPEALFLAQDLLRRVLDLHRAGLSRLLSLVPAEAAVALTHDPEVATLLLLHDLHPESVDKRVAAALARLALSGWVVEVSRADADGVVVHTTRTGDPKRTATGDRVRALIDKAVLDAAPEAGSVIVTGDVLEDAQAGFVSVARLSSRGPLVGGGRA